MASPLPVRTPSVRPASPDGAGRASVTLHAVPQPATVSDLPSSPADEPGRDAVRRRPTLSMALVVPLVLVNAIAVYGQAGWAYEHLAPIVVIAVGFAAAIESIGVYLAAEAHQALMAGDASLRLRLGSYAVGGLVGVLNYAHYAPGLAPNPLAVTFGLLSACSPWLWAIRSRSLNRDRLRELGQVDPRAVRFSMLRWALYPVRTFRAFRGAVWAGVVSPGEAVAAIDRTPDDADEGPDELTRAALIEAGRLLGAGKRVTRDPLAAAIRARGLSISTERAGQLVRDLATDIQEVTAS